MPKNQFINPKELRKAGFIEFGKIPVNQYNKTLAEERKNFTNEDLIRIYHDMAVIRNFEEMINAIKISNEYNGVKYNHPGPAHLGIGQEPLLWVWLTRWMWMISFSGRIEVMLKF